MRRLKSVDDSLLNGEAVVVDTDVPRGCAPVTYEIDGFDTVHNPLARKVNGRRIRQTTLPIVFSSGLENSANDGVSVEAVLAVCSDHLGSKQMTPEANAAYAKATAHIKKALEALTKNHQSHPR